VLAVKAPGYGDRKKEMLQDIAITLGATVVSEEVGLKLVSDVCVAAVAGRVAICGPAANTVPAKKNAYAASNPLKKNAARYVIDLLCFIASILSYYNKLSRYHLTYIDIDGLAKGLLQCYTRCGFVLNDCVYP
jgi:hypothetical protein